MVLDTSRTTDGVETSLEESRCEGMPFDSVGERMGYLPDGFAITRAPSPTLGLDAIIEWIDIAGVPLHSLEQVPDIGDQRHRPQEGS